MSTATTEATSTALTGSFVQLLLRGLLAGLIAGLLAGAVAFVIGEPHIEAAIALEEAASADTTDGHSHGAAEPDGHSHGAAEPGGHSHGDDALVSRSGQKAGLFLATTLAGLALGAIYASVLHFARRHTAVPGYALALATAGFGWLAIEAVPFFKYPANPPAVGDPDTISQRTWLWLATVILGLVAVSVAVVVRKALATQELRTVRLVAPAFAFLAVVILGYLVLPTIDEVSDDFPATLLWEFRISSLAVQATLWACLGAAFAFLTERADRRAEVSV